MSTAGDVLPGRFPAVADAVRRGGIGLEAARGIVNAWKAVRPRAATAEALDALIESLIETASTADTETVQDAAGWWSLEIDPDGAEIRYREQRRKRALRIGRTLLDGSTSATLALMPEHLALLRELLQSRLRSGGLIRIEPGGEADATTDGPEWREETGPDGGEPRTRAQQDYDTLIDVVEAGARAETADATVHETVITVTADEVEARRGQAWAPGIMAGLPLPVVERRACTGTTRLLVLGPKAEPLYLSAAHRLFSPAQRKALTLAAGGPCQVPGCGTPAPYGEAHQGVWNARDGGRTHVDNGIVLCSHQHHVVHAQHPTLEIRRHLGVVFVVPATRTGPPHPLQRSPTHSYDSASGPARSRADPPAAPPCGRRCGCPRRPGWRSRDRPRRRARRGPDGARAGRGSAPRRGRRPGRRRARRRSARSAFARRRRRRPRSSEPPRDPTQRPASRA